MIRNHTSVSTALLATLGLVSIAGCAGEDPNQLVVRPEVHVIAAAPNEPLTLDRLVFPAAGNQALLQRRVGEVLVSSQGTTGFLRRVTAAPLLDGDTIVIGTQRADLPDVFGGGRMHFQVAPGGDGSGPMGIRAPRARVRDVGDIKYVVGQAEIEKLGLEIDGGVTGNLMITPNISFSFSPIFDFDFDFRWLPPGVEHFRAGLGGKASLTLGGTINAKGGVEGGATVCLDRLPGLPFEFMAGPIPVKGAIVPEIDLYGSLAIEGDLEVTASVTAEAEAELGIDWKDGEWTPIKEFSMQFHPEAEYKASGGFGVMLALPVKFQIVFYDFPVSGPCAEGVPDGLIQGPYFTLRPYISETLEFGATAKELVIQIGAQGILGGELEILNRWKLVDIGELTVFDEHWQVFGKSTGSCDELAAEKGWPGGLCEKSYDPIFGTCGFEGFQTDDCGLCCPDPSKGGLTGPRDRAQATIEHE